MFVGGEGWRDAGAVFFLNVLLVLCDFSSFLKNGHDTEESFPAWLHEGFVLLLLLSMFIVDDKSFFSVS